MHAKSALAVLATALMAAAPPALSQQQQQQQAPAAPRAAPQATAPQTPAQTPAQTAARPAATPESFHELASDKLPAVVNIATTRNGEAPMGRLRDLLPQLPPGMEEFFGGPDRDRLPPGPERALGSGFVIDPQGYIVTNNHVIEDAEEITVILQDKAELRAKLVGRDPRTDIALLKVEPEQPLTALQWGDSDDARVGDWVVAIGNPFGLGGTVTAGIISARQRDINAGPYDDFIQTDASINRGNSGGPMFNLNGEVIGINTAIFSPSGGSVGIGFAIPSNLARSVVAQLKEYGRTRRGWLGVRIQAVTPEIAESLGLRDPRGALVASVTPGGPAAVSGIEAGDVIVRFDGKDITEMRRLPRVVAETQIERAVPVEVMRKGKPMTIQVKVGELEAAEESGLLAAAPDAAPAPERSTEALGLKLTGISDELRQRFELKPGVNGVLVTEVEGGSQAAEKGMRPGDVIVEVGQEVVTSPADVANRIRKAREDNKRSVLLLVDRQGDLRFVALPLSQG